ncbi:MAG TPA: NAD(P)H-hydrate epimerase [Thermoanaerobaculia bacterium]|nr:NAD(P)H-hydrate epimerase [Thermoanaerobaculia bacterium]
MMIFHTIEGRVVPAVTTDQMREIDRIAIEETGPNLFQMMENAGRNLAGLATDRLGADWQRAKVVVLAGTRGNGGGGICAARHLANRGADVTLVTADPAGLSEVTRWQYEIYRHTRGAITDDGSQLDADIILDALIGYGLRSAPRGRTAELIRWANASPAPLLALDVPSGVDSTSGETPGEMVHAKWTLTLALPKTGLLPRLTGELYLGDIGIPEETYRRAGIDLTSPFGAAFVIPLVATPL